MVDEHSLEHEHHHHGSGHNHASGEHLHSHPHEEDASGDLQVLTDQFIDGFVTAKDKAAYLELAGIPREIADVDGGPSLKLVDVQLTTEWQVGTASPSFGSAELSYLPYPGGMIQERSNMGFVYVSARRKDVVDLRRHLFSRLR
jgi:hypothetical protein